MCFAPQRRTLFEHLNFQKWSEADVVLYILSWTPASRHNGVHLFDISTSKSVPNPTVFHTFDFQMCFVPQRRALFRHHNFQKWSDIGVFCAFWLGHVLRANSVQLFISHLTTWLRTCRFSEPTFRPSGATNQRKNAVFLLPFRAPASSVFWLFLFPDLLSSFLLFSDSPHLCFSSVHIVGNLTLNFLR